MRFKANLRQLLMFLLLTVVFLFGAVSVHAESAGFSDALWTNGGYNATLGDMAGRRLYVYGLVDAQGGAAEPLADNQIALASDRPVNRLEIAEMLYRLCGGGSTETVCPFTDVPEQYAQAVGWMNASGVTRGVGGDLYGTGDVTRVQFLTMLSRLLAWEDSGAAAQWGDLGYEDRMNILALENGLLPVGIGGDGFTHGDAYLILLALAEQRFPEVLKPVRAELSRPRQITVSASSFMDAQEQIDAAVQYAPYSILVSFTANTPAVDLRAFREKYNISNPAHTGELHRFSAGPRCAVFGPVASRAGKRGGHRGHVRRLGIPVSLRIAGDHGASRFPPLRKAVPGAAAPGFSQRGLPSPQPKKAAG